MEDFFLLLGDFLMLEFDELLNISNILLGPNGCPWDKEQTFDSLKPYLLEEVHELLEALDLKRNDKIQEELGDCFYALVFLAKLADQKDIFNLQDTLRLVAEKLIRRHPHIFSELKVESSDDVMRNWEEIKKKEGKKNPIQGIPPSLPALARAQKVILKLRRAKKELPCVSDLSSEEDLGNRLWNLVRQAESSGFDAESALRKVCQTHERNWSMMSQS